MPQLRRITTTPNSPLRILIDQPEPGSPDAGMAVGGTFFFAPAGQDGDTAQVSDYAARVVMSDPGLAPHFKCSPPFGAQTPPVEPPADEVAVAAQEPEAAPERARRGPRTTTRKVSEE